VFDYGVYYMVFDMIRAVFCRTY